jgi:hypothetical protein
MLSIRLPRVMRILLGELRLKYKTGIFQEMSEGEHFPFQGMSTVYQYQ